jgi:hypothetical protein
MNEIYFVYKQGVYGQGVYWIGFDIEEGKRKCDQLATQDKDDYHLWELYQIQRAFR